MIGNESRSDKFGTNGTMPHKDTPQSNGMPHPFGNPEGVYGATPQSNTDWREEFNKTFPRRAASINKSPWDRTERRDISIIEIHDFISQFLEAEKKRKYTEIAYLTWSNPYGKEDQEKEFWAYEKALDAVLQKLS